MQEKYRLHTPAAIAASASGIALVALIVIFPSLLNEIAQVEEELIVHREEYQALSNKIWHHLMEQSQQLRLTSAALRRGRSACKFQKNPEIS